MLACAGWKLQNILTAFPFRELSKEPQLGRQRRLNLCDRIISEASRLVVLTFYAMAQSMDQIMPEFDWSDCPSSQKTPGMTTLKIIASCRVL